ncbi:hypothetical protein ACLUWG_03230 [Bifidobacterium apri]|uniref:hypothetical protein n=1 Tax=Bifidobacterium apri TaxID=1769423 RepID=UPI0039931BB2
MMATNITQKDATLRELMDWLEGYRKNCERTLGSMLAKSDPQLRDVAVGVGVLKGAVTAVRRVEQQCESMLGYTGTSMPLEVPNQSEDARQETGNAR